MSFGHPSQQSHKMAGFAKAAKSPKTPAHLRTHLQKLSQGQGIPLKNDSEAESTEPQTGNSTMLPGAGRSKVRKQPKTKASAFYGEM